MPSKLQTLDAWLEKLNNLRIQSSNGNILGTERILKILDHLNYSLIFNCPIIGVAGTNGKSSCVYGLQNLALNNKLNIGTFTSPHLIYFNERIQVNGQPVSNDLICSAFEKIESTSFKLNIYLSYFDYAFLACLIIFQNINKSNSNYFDLLIFEMGIGAKKDIVNLLNFNASVITSIGLDHQDILGNNLESIIDQKSAVSRANCPVFFPEDVLGLNHNINNHYLKNYLIKQIKFYQAHPIEIPKNKDFNQTIFKNLFPKLKPKINILYRPFKLLKPLGRQSFIAKDYQFNFFKSDLICDVAHNPESIYQLALYLKKIINKNNYSKIIFGIGLQKHKYQNNMFSPLVSINQNKNILQSWVIFNLKNENWVGLDKFNFNYFKDKFNKIKKFDLEDINNFNKFNHINSEENNLIVILGGFSIVGFIFKKLKIDSNFKL